MSSFKVRSGKAVQALLTLKIALVMWFETTAGTLGKTWCIMEISVRTSARPSIVTGCGWLVMVVPFRCSWMVRASV